MNWDDRAAVTAKKRWGISGKPNAEMEPLDWLNDGQGIGFRLGARWQREQLLTDEAVERVALQILADDCDITLAEASEDWSALFDERKALYRNRARAAINALLGEEK